MSTYEEGGDEKAIKWIDVWNKNLGQWPFGRDSG
jgi:hypothetical protein